MPRSIVLATLFAAGGCIDDLADADAGSVNPERGPIGKADQLDEADSGACDNCSCSAGETTASVELSTGPARLVDAAVVGGRLAVAMVAGTSNTSGALLGLVDLDAVDEGFQYEGGLGSGGSLQYVQGLSLGTTPDGFAAAYSRVDHTYGTSRCVALVFDLEGNIQRSTVDLRSGRGCSNADITWTGDGYALLTSGANHGLETEQYPLQLATSHPLRQSIDGPSVSADMRQQSWDGQRRYVAYRKLIGIDSGQQNTEAFVRVAGVGAPIRLSSEPGHTYWPNVQSGPGGAAAAWIDRTPQGYVMRYTVVDESGQPRFAPMELQSSGYYPRTGISLAAGSASYGIAWIDAADRLWFAEVDDAGEMLAAPRIIESGATNVRLANDDGDYWAIWQAVDSIQATRICGS